QAMARAVCDGDPRTIAQRRADALGALAAGNTTLACACPDAACPTKTGDTPAVGGAALIHVVANAATVHTPVDRHNHGEPPPPRPITPETTLDELLAIDPEPDAPAHKTPPAQLL